jgi:hypothetical protein
VAKRDLQRLRETTPTENRLLEGFRWQPHHPARVLWANNLHILNRAIKETPTGRNQTDPRSTIFGMKRIKLRSWPEIGSDGDVLLTPYVPEGDNRK